MNNNQKIAADRVIEYFHSMDIDGEVMEYILNGAHMTEQMLRQLVMKAPNEDLDSIIAERNSLKATKQTAVEWLVEQMIKEISKHVSIEFSGLGIELIDRAKQMEKEQIKEAYKSADECTWDSDKIAEEYYNETFGK